MTLVRRATITALVGFDSICLREWHPSQEESPGEPGLREEEKKEEE
jgi:hypothetical protein